MYISPIDAIKRAIELDNYRRLNTKPNLHKLQESAILLRGIENNLKLNG